MKAGKLNVILDGFWGSSGKGKFATWLADRFNVTRVSSSNFPNAGHTARFPDGTKFVSKAIPTAAILKRVKGMGMECFLSPGSGFRWDRLAAEWEEAGRPRIHVHGRASVVTDDHARREREGVDSTKHIASTMQGSGAAISDKVLRRPDVTLARDDEEGLRKAFEGRDAGDQVSVVRASQFRELTWNVLDNGQTWLHEGSQGFALSIDHGSHYPFCLSGDSRVVLSDGSTRKIRNVRIGDVVLSKTESGEVVHRPVVNTWRRPTGAKKWFNIITETSVYNSHDQQWIGPKLTGDHKVQTTRGKVSVQDLVPGDQVFVNECELVEDGLQVFLGSLLGDGTVPACKKNRARARLRISHGEAQSGYALGKALIMRAYVGGSDRIIRYGSGSLKEGDVRIRYASSNSVVVKRLATKFGCYGLKRPDVAAIVAAIDERGLAIWYQDDGQRKDTVNGQEVYLHTNGFDKKTVEALAQALQEKFGLNFSVHEVRGVKKHGRGEKRYPILRLSRKSHGKWFDMIAKYVHPQLEHKLPSGTEGDWCGSWTRTGEIRCATETVLDVAPSRDFRGMKWCYDIEVDGTHNFFVKNGKGAFNVENCTSRNCTLQAAMDQMAVPPGAVGDVYLNLRTFPIRVGNVVEDGETVGFSGDFYPDCEPRTWEQIAAGSGMPAAEAAALAERERTTVTKRIRRACTFSFHGLRDAVKVNGATKLILNFVQYVDWADTGLRGEGAAAFSRLSPKTRALIDRIEDAVEVPVVLVGTGADHEDVVVSPHGI